VSINQPICQFVTLCINGTGQLLKGKAMPGRENSSRYQALELSDLESHIKSLQSSTEHEIQSIIEAIQDLKELVGQVHARLLLNAVESSSQPECKTNLKEILELRKIQSEQEATRNAIELDKLRVYAIQIAFQMEEITTDGCKDDPGTEVEYLINGKKIHPDIADFIRETAFMNVPKE
jgi:hypothetical protein